jgi:AcrR family transcriptional regulator
VPDSGRRAAATAATRSAIIEAARELLATRQWRQFSLEAVATRAGVTRVTVYNQVGSKLGLLDAVLSELTARARMDQLLTDSAALPAGAARTFIVERTCRFWHAERAVLRPLSGLAAVDAEVAGTLAQREEWRGNQIRQLLYRLAAGSVDPPFGHRAALAGVIAVTSFPTYDALGTLADSPKRAAELIDHLVASLTGGGPA